ncbi:MAG: hypothetical protein IPM29_26705 [Planctomycetes bacterium]|nr:hypothetical protein [Planctomycetota bacterium]
MRYFLYTIDVELSPGRSVATPEALRDNYRRGILGTARGTHGLAWQLDVLGEHGIRAVNFVEPLFALAVGDEWLAEIVTIIESRGHEVQLHAHTEWLHRMQPAQLEQHGLPSWRGDHLYCYDLDEQTRILQVALDTLSAHAKTPITAFRAGNFGANLDTLRALARLGLRYDSSFNVAHRGGHCRIALDPVPHDAVSLDHLAPGLTEVPVTCFHDTQGTWRPAQLCAISSSELGALLRAADHDGREHVVFVSHSFELMNRRRTRPHWIHVRRLSRLAERIASSQTWRGVGFNDLPLSPAPLCDRSTPPGYGRLNSVRRSLRIIQQAVGRVLD